MTFARRARAACTALAALAALAVLPAAAPRAPRVPALVFVSRGIPHGVDAAQVPGVGPRGRTLAVGGRLMLREAGGRVRPLLPASALHDVSDPSVSWDAAHIAFAGLVAPDSAWRIYTCNADGSNLQPLTRSDRAVNLAPLGPDAARFARYDDIDPVWLADGRVCFASTRFPQLAADNVSATTNLYTLRADGTDLNRLTTERFGAEEPSVDPASGRIVYARWWTSRWLPSEREAGGVTLDRAQAVPMDTVDLWHAITILANGDGGRLAGGDPRGRASVAAYQPVVREDGTLLGVVSEHLALAPAPGRLGVRRCRGGFAVPEPLAGFGADPGSACAPALLPDGRVVVAFDAGGAGDFGLVAIGADGRSRTPLVDLPGTAELDAAPLVVRRPPRATIPPLDFGMADLPVRTTATFDLPINSFRFDCLNVFDSGGLDTVFPDAPPMERNIRIRFFAALARSAAQGGDTVVLVHEIPVDPDGAVHIEDMPGDVPMFEQLVDSKGRVLRSAMGPAHVPGFNFASAGGGTKCVGCHAGHSALTVPPSASLASWVNASPSAEVTASSTDPASSPRAVQDRRTRGPLAQTAWLAAGAEGQRLVMRWRWPIDVARVVLYPVTRDAVAGTDLKILECELVLWRGGQVVDRAVLTEPWPTSGIRAEFNGRTIDALEVLPRRVTGRVLGRPAVAIAEIETIARLNEE